MLSRLDRVIPRAPNAPEPDADHPMRKVTLQVAFEPTGWTPERAAKVAKLFDDLAPEWHTRMDLNRIDALTDALARGGPFPPGLRLEVGSGVGIVTPRIVDAIGDGQTFVALDLSAEMLRHAPADIAPRVRADSSRLPFADGEVAVAVLVNMLLFPTELDRVLRRPDGVLVWVSTVGPATPIHLSADEVARALPRKWDGVHSEAGWGTWAAFRRTAAAT